MTVLTLVPEDLARPGYRFRYRGANLPGATPNDGEECKGCPVQRICFGLEAGRSYEVAEVRDVAHPCALHDGGKARVVTVVEVAFTSTLEDRHLRGTAAPWTPIPCGMPECPHYALCHPVGPQAGAHHQILRVGHPVDCPAGYTIHAVELKPMPRDAFTKS